MRVLLIVYDNDSYIHNFPHAIAAVGAILKKHDYDVTVYDQAINHYPESHLLDYMDNNRFDVVGLSFIAGYYEYRKALKISEAINQSKNRPLFLIGGHGPTPEPEYFLRKTGADVVVMGEGEETVLELLDVIKQKRSLHDIKGIAFTENGKCVVNERRTLIKDIDSLPFQAYELFNMSYYRLIRPPKCVSSDFCIPILSGRGCIFHCNFCYRLDEGFRARSEESIVEEIKLLKKDYGITYINFNDELLMSSKDRTISLCNAFIMNKLNIKWQCNGRLNYATREVLDLMKKAGCVFINYGIESMDDLSLKKMNKALTTKMIIRGVEATIDAGISPGLNIIFGNIGETRRTLKKGVEFILKYDDFSSLRTIRPVTPYPGSPLYYYAIEKGMLKDCADFYENKHVNSDLLSVNFTELSDDEFYEAIFEANQTLLDNYCSHMQQSYHKQLVRLYQEKDASFRGFRHT
jgi:radical SAM superfamily enzyme YgiQ (UPF0313 family)